MLLVHYTQTHCWGCKSLYHLHYLSLHPTLTNVGQQMLIIWIFCLYAILLVIISKWCNNYVQLSHQIHTHTIDLHYDFVISTMPLYILIWFHLLLFHKIWCSTKRLLPIIYIKQLFTVEKCWASCVVIVSQPPLWWWYWLHCTDTVTHTASLSTTPHHTPPASSSS